MVSEEMLTIIAGIGIFTIIISFIVSFLHLKIYFSEPVNNIINYYWGVAYLSFFTAIFSLTLAVITRSNIAVFYVFLFLIFFNYFLNLIAIIVLKISHSFHDMKTIKLKIIRLLIQMSLFIYIIIASGYIIVVNDCLNFNDNILFFVYFKSLYFNLFTGLYSLILLIIIFFYFPKDYEITGIFFKISFGVMAVFQFIRVIDLFAESNILKILSLSLATISVFGLQLSVLLEYKKDMALIRKRRSKARRKEDKRNAI